MTSSRRLVSSGSPLEPEIGFSRAVRSGPYVCVAGTAPIAEGGGVAARGDVYGQAVRCLDIAERALREAGASPADVVRTRVMLTDITQWREAARAHAERSPECGPRARSSRYRASSIRNGWSNSSSTRSSLTSRLIMRSGPGAAGGVSGARAKVSGMRFARLISCHGRSRKPARHSGGRP